METEVIIEGWRRVGFKRAGGLTGTQKATELIELALHSVGTFYTRERRREIIRLVEEYERSVLRIDEITEDISSLLQTIPHEVEHMQSIKGLSSLYIAVILGNTGDLSQYEHGKQLLSQAGLNLAESTSGKHRGKIVISNRGRRQLRKYLYLAVIGLVVNNPEFKSWHAHNIQVLKMKKQKSIFKLIGKIARILVAMSRAA